MKDEVTYANVFAVTQFAAEVPSDNCKTSDAWTVIKFEDFLNFF